MKKEDKYIMQITTIHKIQNAFDTSMKALKFIWRHAFVLIVFGLLIAAFLIYPAINWLMFFTEFVIALGLDKLKMSFKLTGTYSNSREQMFESARRNMDSSRFGSAAWATNPAMAGSPANSLYNLDNTTTRYT